MQGDGHTMQYKGEDEFSRYGTISPRLADDVMRLCTHCGYSGIIKIALDPETATPSAPSIPTATMGYRTGIQGNEIVSKHTYYKISVIRKQNQPWMNKKVNDSNEEKLIEYSGKVYCIEMPSSHLYYMRETKLTASMLVGNSRNGQKGTIGLVIPERDMPFTKDGIRPDLIINPHAIPTRMTIGQFLETLLGKGGVTYGAFGDCTAFNNQEINKVKTYGEHLNKMGYHSSGNEVMYNGMTGEQMETEIFIGPTYYMRLKHMVKDKVNYRARGPNAALTRQPVSGRANDGGLRIGEMERDSIIGHGISNFLNESMMERADKYHVAVCNKTGMLAIYNPSKDLFISPMADGPLKFNGVVGDELRLEKITKFGRDFSIVAIPYSMKLFLQELQTMNIQMHIITEDNIEQLLPLLGGTMNNNIFQSPSSTPVKKGGQSMTESITVKDDEELAQNGGENLQEEINPEEEEVAQNGGDVLQEEDEITDPDDEINQHGGGTKQWKEKSLFQEDKDKEENTIDNHELSSHLPFKMGEMVYLRGDRLKPNREWRVKNIGNKFLTIETFDTEDLMTSDTIKVVSPLDIYPISQGFYGRREEAFPPNFNMNEPNTLSSMEPHSQNTATPTAINIKFVNGPDHSVATGETIPVQPIQANYNATQSETIQPHEINAPDQLDKVDFTKNFIIKKV
jgi:hypothetical protein